MFDEDAKKASWITWLNFNVPRWRRRIKVPMCGVPFHAAEMYIKKLIKQGQKVCDLRADRGPKSCKRLGKAWGYSNRYAGMVIEDNILESSNNYIVCITGKKNYGLAIADVSTGDFLVTQINDEQILLQELTKFHPSECVFSDENVPLYDFLSEQQETLYGMNLSPYNSYLFKESNAEEKLLSHFGINDLAVLNFNDPTKDAPAIIAAAVLLGYIQENAPYPT